MRRSRSLGRTTCGALLIVALSAVAAPSVSDTVWHGDWTVTRDDPRLLTRAGAELLSLRIVAGEADDSPVLHWSAGRAICLDPLDEPCEWVGARGESSVAMLSGDTLVAVLRVSADDGDPFVLHLRPSQSPSSPITSGVLLGGRGELRYRVEAHAAAAQ